MKCINIIASFELELNKLDDAVNKPVTEDSIYWLNQAVMKFVKLRFNGNLPHRTSYEQNEKRMRDLIRLYKERDYDIPEVEEHPSYNSYEFDYPEDMMFTLNEDVTISNTNGEYVKDVSVFECTADSFMYRVTNNLTDFHYRYHWARPLRVRTRNGFRLLTDKNYNIHSYSIGYLKVPTTITSQDPETEYADFDDYIWMEIIKIAALMYIENQGDLRYNTISNEVNTQE